MKFSLHKYFYFSFQLNYKQEGDDEKVTLAVKILSMTKEEVEEALTFVSTTLGTRSRQNTYSINVQALFTLKLTITTLMANSADDKLT